MEESDLVIVGAGIHGLTNAATHHRLYPDAKIVVLVADPGIGGTWAAHRIFPGLNSNNLLGMYEHPDFPMDEATFGIKEGEHIPAEKMLQYLTAFTKASEIDQYLRLNTRVEVIEKKEEKWIVHCKSSSAPDAYTITTPKLIIAIGITNKPKIPSYPTSPAFTPTIIHSKDFPSHFQRIVRPNTHTLVIGGGKSASDVAYACATQPNSTATILIRPTGAGPHQLFPSHVTPFTLWLEKLVFTRFFGYFSPCPWASMSGIDGWFRWFLHSTWLGRKLVAAFWHALGEDGITLNKLRDHPSTQKLVPWRGAFEISNCLGIHNYPSSFFDLVRSGRISIVIGEVDTFAAGKEALLKNSDSMHVDAVVCATGWSVAHSIRFEPHTLHTSMTLPTSAPPTPTESSLINAATAHLLTTYPVLARDTRPRNHPDPARRTATPHPSTHQPFRQYKFMIPPAHMPSRAIAFSGALYCLGTFPCAYIQSLYIAAYFSGALPIPPANTMLEETYRDSQYGVLRSTGGYGRVAPDLVFDSLAYFDGVLGDVGVSGRRKGGAVREVWGSYGPEDYRGVVGEWMGRVGWGRREGGIGVGKKDV